MGNIKKKVFDFLNVPGYRWNLICKYYKWVQGKRLKIYVVESPQEYCERNGIRCFLKENRQSYNQVVVPKLNGDKTTKEKRAKLPLNDIYLSELPNAVIIGGYDGAICGDAVINERVTYFPDRTWAPKPPWIIAESKDHRRIMGEIIQPKREIKAAIDLCGRFADNWWHLTYELFGKMYYIQNDERYNNIPLLIDEAVLTNESNRRLLDSINFSKREIISVKKNEQIKIAKLIYVNNPITEISGYYTKEYGMSCISNDVYILCRHNSCMFIRDAVFKSLNISEKKKQRNIFLARRRKGRLINEKDVAERFLKKGFEIVYSDDLSFEEEVLLFNEANVLVSTLGGALTNLIYCSKDATVVCIFPHSIISCMTAYADIADMIGFDFYCQDALPKNDPSSYDGCEYLLPDYMCNELIKRIGEYDSQ